MNSVFKINNRNISIEWNYGGSEYIFDISKLNDISNYKCNKDCDNDEECCINLINVENYINSKDDSLYGIVKFYWFVNNVKYTAKIKIDYMFNYYHEINDIENMDSLFLYLDIVKPEKFNNFDDDWGDNDDEDRFKDPNDVYNNILKTTNDLIDFLEQKGFNLDKYNNNKYWCAIVKELTLKGYNYVYRENEWDGSSGYNLVLTAIKEKVENKQCFDLITYMANLENSVNYICFNNNNIIFNLNYYS